MTTASQPLDARRTTTEPAPRSATGPTAPPALPRRRRRTARGPGGAPAGTGPAGPAGRRPAAAPRRRSTDREVDRLAHAVALLWLEVESGRRRPAAVAPLLDHDLWHRLRDRWVRGGPPGRLVRLLVSRHSTSLCDVVAVVARDDRTGAITFRLRRRPDGWCVEDAGLPEHDGAR